MEEFVNSLKENLSESLDVLAAESNRLARSYKSAAVVKEACEKLRAYINANPFEDRSQEINYFKKLAPAVYGLLFYHLKEYSIEFEKQHESREKLEVLLTHELEVTQQFYERHRDFYRYYFEGDTSRDEALFVRNKGENGMLDEVEILMGADFCVGCYWVARILANERLKAYLTVQLESSRRAVPVPSIEVPELKWTASPTDAVELIYGLYLARCFNNGSVTLRDIVRWFEVQLEVDLKRYIGIWQDIKKRKKLLTKFIDFFRGLVHKKAEEEDEN